MFHVASFANGSKKPDYEPIVAALLWPVYLAGKLAGILVSGLRSGGGDDLAIWVIVLASKIMGSERID